MRERKDSVPEKSDLIAVTYHWASSLRLSLESESLILPSPGHTYIRDYLNTIRFKLQIDSHYVPRLHPTPSSSLQMRLEERGRMAAAVMAMEAMLFP